MRIIGSDFTSDPRPGKPITATWCRTKGKQLIVEKVEPLLNFQSFALLLASKGPWVAGFDFPFGQPQRLINDLAWPKDWKKYVEHVAGLGKRQFRATLDAYRAQQPEGEKEHLRDTDRRAKSLSPMKVYGVPVGVMFCEGTPSLLASPAAVLPFDDAADADRIVVEAYPKLVAQKVVGDATYKTDDRKKVTARQGDLRKAIMDVARTDDNTSIIRTLSVAARSRKASGSKPPSPLRQPK